MHYVKDTGDLKITAVVDEQCSEALEPDCTVLCTQHACQRKCGFTRLDAGAGEDVTSRRTTLTTGRVVIIRLSSRLSDFWHLLQWRQAARIIGIPHSGYYNSPTGRREGDGRHE
jgi:hypothetical protein